MTNPTASKNTAASTRTAGLNAVMASLPSRLRATPAKGRGVSGANLNVTKSKNGVPVPVQVKVVQKGDRGFSKTTKYMDVDANGAVTGLKPVDRELIAVVAVLDGDNGADVYVSTVGKIQDLMMANYEERVAKDPSKVIKQTFYRPIDLGAKDMDFTALLEAFSPKPAPVAEVEEVVAEPVAEVEEVITPAVVTVIEVDEGITAMVIDPAAMEIPVSDISLEDEVAEGEAEVLAELGF